MVHPYLRRNCFRSSTKAEISGQLLVNAVTSKVESAKGTLAVSRVGHVAVEYIEANCNEV